MAADIEMKLNGKPATIKGIRKLGRVPMRYCVLFDTSGSQRVKFEEQKNLAAQVLSHVVSADTDHGWLVLVVDQPRETIRRFLQQKNFPVERGVLNQRGCP